MAEVMDNVKDFIEKYCKILHLANMPTNVRARFDKYAETKSFDGDMKRWPDLLELADRVKNGDLDALPTLRDEKWKDLYNDFQGIFETMSEHTDDFKYKDETTKKFFETWYGDGKLFNKSQPIDGLEDRIAHFAQFLEKNKTNLLFSFNKNKNDFNYGEYKFDYDKFIRDIKAKKYLTDTDMRNSLFQVVQYTQNYANRNSSKMWYMVEEWPEKVEKYDFSQPVIGPGGSVIASALPLDTDEWFKVKYNRGFKHRAQEIFNRLLTSSAVLEDFTKYDYRGEVAKHIQQAIKETDYANETSDNYIPPIYDDQKNFLQRVDDKLDKFKENQIDPWANVLRGTRRYFSDYARNIIEGISSVKIKEKDGKTRKIKPTDGLKGILDNAEAIKAKIQEKDKKATKHFDWFTKKLKIYSDKMSKAFDGAFRNPKQMRAIVSQIIVDAVNEGKVAEAKSALEVLSTMKYGIMHSRTMDALGKEDMSVLSDKGLSWNKYEGVKFVTSAMDKTAKFAIMTVGRGLAAARNQFIFRNNLKFRGNTKTIEKAHENWKQKNSIDSTNNATLGAVEKELQREARRQHSIDVWLNRHGGKNNIENDVNAYNQLGNDVETLQQQIQNKTNEREQKNELLYQIQQALDAANNQQTPSAGLVDQYGNPISQNNTTAQLAAQKQQLEAEIAQLDQDVADITNDVANKNTHMANDKNKIDTYQTFLDKSNEAQDNIDALNTQKQQLTDAQKTWKEDHKDKDKYMELMAFWDMLESFWKSHQLTFAANKMRDKFLMERSDAEYLDADGKPRSKAKKMSDEYLAKYLDKYQNVA